MAAKLSLVRIWGHGDGTKTILQTGPYQYDARVFRALDYVIAQARAYNLRVRSPPMTAAGQLLRLHTLPTTWKIWYPLLSYLILLQLLQHCLMHSCSVGAHVCDNILAGVLL